MDKRLREFLVMPENCNWYSVKGYSANIVFASEKCWFMRNHKIAIMDIENETCFLYTVDE